MLCPGEEHLDTGSAPVVSQGGPGLEDSCLVHVDTGWAHQCPGVCCVVWVCVVRPGLSLLRLASRTAWTLAKDTEWEPCHPCLSVCVCVCVRKCLCQGGFGPEDSCRRHVDTGLAPPVSCPFPSSTGRGPTLRKESLAPGFQGMEPFRQV